MTTRRKRWVHISLTSLPPRAFSQRADVVESSTRGVGKGGAEAGRPRRWTRGEARVVRAAAGERERWRARMGWTSRAMRREGVVVGRGGSGVEVNNGGVVGAN